MTLKRIIIFGLILVFIFSLGYSIGINAIPFDDSIKSLYQQYFQSDYDNEKYTTIDPILLDTNIDSLIKIKSESDIIQKRNDIIRYIWKDDGFPHEKLPASVDVSIQDKRYDNLNNLERIDKITISMEFGIESYVYLFIADKKNNELFIYHQGHGGDFIRGKKTINHFLENGYSVMAFTMPLKGLNTKPTVDLPNYGVIKLTQHDHFYFLDSEEFSSMTFFVEPLAVSINYIKQSHNFDSIHMTGISGGGWTTHIYSAIDDRISTSFPVGSTLPSYIRLNVPENGDYEKNLSDFYNIANFLELYVMGSYGDNRMQVKIINQYDRCCNFGIGYQTFEPNIKNSLSVLGKGTFEVFLDDTHKDHKISDKALEKILNSLQK